MSRRQINFPAISLLMNLAFSLFFAPPLFALEDAIVAVVNDEVITLKDIRDYAHAVLVQMKAEGVPSAQIKSAMADLEVNGINRLIENKLILEEANRLKIEADKGAVENKMNEMKSSYPSEKAFLDAMITEGATPADLSKKIAEQIKIRMTIEREVREKVYVNPQEVTAYYKEHFDQYTYPQRVEVDSIFVPKGKDAIPAKEKAEQALARLKSGAVFSDVAKEFSQGPNLGTIAKGQLLPIVENIIFSLKENTISDVIEVASGFYIFRVKKNLPETIASLEEVKEKITDELFQGKFRQKYREWVDKLKGKAFIDIKGQE
jgi:parvulin-like peptidyl-prolyl isomerase